MLHLRRDAKCDAEPGKEIHCKACLHKGEKLSQFKQGAHDPAARFLFKALSEDGPNLIGKDILPPKKSTKEDKEIKKQDTVTPDTTSTTLPAHAKLPAHRAGRPRRLGTRTV